MGHRLVDVLRQLLAGHHDPVRIRHDLALGGGERRPAGGPDGFEELPDLFAIL